MPTAISWAQETWNPTLGCKRVSAGCEGCYAIVSAHRWASSPHPSVAAAYQGLTQRTAGRVDWTGTVRVLPERFEQPLAWSAPRRVFVNSMSDLGHPAIPREALARIFAVMALTGRHTYLVLTKRPDHLARVLTSDDFAAALEEHTTDIIRSTPLRFRRRIEAPVREGWTSRSTDEGRAWAPPWPLPNVHVGVSVEDQASADERIPKLERIPAAVRWLSIEPLVAPVDLAGYIPRAPGQGGHTAACRHGVEACPRCDTDPDVPVDWVVVGGESGPRARPMEVTWARNLRGQCALAGVPFHFKQAGSVLAQLWGCASTKGDRPEEWPEPFPRQYPGDQPAPVPAAPPDLETGPRPGRCS